MPGEEAFVSLVTNDNYSTGALALGQSLRDSSTQRKLSLLITNEVSHEMRGRLASVWDELTVVEELDSGDSERLALLTRPELGVTFSKIHAWQLTQYSKCVFLDADTLVLENVDELFDREELSAAPDIGWPDCFNSGVFVFEPSIQTFTNLLDMARQTGSFDGGDQGLLNLYWADWATKDIKYHLPFIYNMVPNATYGYAPAFQRFGRNAKIVHFIGPVKPWQHRYLQDLQTVILSPGSYSSQSAVYDLIKRWWQVYTTTEQPATWPGAIPPGLPPSSPLPLSSSSSHPPPPPPHHHSSTTHHHHSHTSSARPTFSHGTHASPPAPLSHSSGVHVHSPQGGTESDVSDSTVRTDSVHLTHPISSSPSPSSPPPSSHPSNSQAEGSHHVHSHDGAAPGTAGSEGAYYPQGKSREQVDFEQGRIDYTGKHRFEFIQEVLDCQLEESTESTELDD